MKEWSLVGCMLTGKRGRVMTEKELEKERWIDDDCAVVSQFYTAKRLHPNIPFYLQDQNGETFEFGWSLIYQYIANISHYPDW